MTNITTGSDRSTENQCSRICKTQKREDSPAPWRKPASCRKARKFERIPYRYKERQFKKWEARNHVV